MYITITHPAGTYSGAVKTRVNQGTDKDPNWYVEFTHDKDSKGPTGDPGYWKQGLDGGFCAFRIDDADSPFEINEGMVRRRVIAFLEKEGQDPTTFLPDHYNPQRADTRENLLKGNILAMKNVLDDLGLVSWNVMFCLDELGIYTLWTFIDNTTDGTKTNHEFQMVKLPNLLAVMGATEGNDDADNFDAGPSRHVMKTFVDTAFVLASTSYENLLPDIRLASTR